MLGFRAISEVCILLLSPTMVGHIFALPSHKLCGGNTDLMFLSVQKEFDFARLRATKKQWTVDRVMYGTLCRRASQKSSSAVAPPVSTFHLCCRV